MKPHSRSLPLLALMPFACLIAGGQLLTSTACAGVANDTISIEDVSIVEGNAGTSVLNFTVSRSSAGAAFAVDWATANGAGSNGATTPSDFTAANGTLNFTQAGATSQTVSVTVNGDTSPEPDETFLVNLSGLNVNIGSASVNDAQGVGTITDDDRIAPVITLNPAATLSVVAGNTFTLTASASGTPAPTYQWYIGIPGVITTPVSGATGATLTTSTAIPRTYWVRATNSKNAADSTAASLTVADGSNALLSGLTLNTGTISPAFNAVTLAYSASEAEIITSVQFTPTVAISGATLTAAINGGPASPLASGSPLTVPLNTGNNTVALKVTATDPTTTKTYNLTVVRSPQVYTSANRDVLEPNRRSWPTAGVSLTNTRFVNLGLQGVGRVPANAIDAATGETLGSISDMQITGFTKNPDGSFSGTLQTLPDRGYNSGLIYSNYAARLNTFNFNFTPYTSAATISVQDQIALTFAGSTRFTYDHDGNPGTAPVFTSGQLADGPAVTLFGTTVPVVAGITTQSDGPITNRLTLDTEGLILDSRPGKTGSGWIGDEYGAFLYHFNADKQLDGQLQLPAALVPHSPVGTNNHLADPPLNGRRINQGMEGIAQSPDGTRLFALLQSATIQDSGTGNPGRSNTRLLVYDISSTDTPSDPIAQYVIQLPRTDDTGSTTNGTTVNRNCAQSAILALSSAQFLILARDGNGRGAPTSSAPAFKSILLADLSDATNIDGIYDAEGNAVAPAGILSPTVTPLSWTEAVNLIGSLDPSTADVARFGLNLNAGNGDLNTICEKWEALAVVPSNDPALPNDYFLFVGNDNDFLSATGKYMDATGTLQSYNADLENDTIVLAYRVRAAAIPRLNPAATAGLSAVSDHSPINLTTATGVFPLGGTFTGNGIAGDTFDPALAPPGTSTITYTLASESVSFTITTTAAPTVAALPTNALTTSLKSSIVLSDNGLASGNGGAEIPAFDPPSKRAFAASNVGVQVVNLADPSAPVRLAPIDPMVDGIGTRDVSHVIVRNGILAVSLVATPDKTLPGKVAFYNAATSAFISAVTVGANPDQLIFTPDGTKVLVPNEGEMALASTMPAGGNPDGSVSIIDVSGGFIAPPVTTANFAAWNGQEDALRACGIRVLPGHSAQIDLEPEYVAVNPDGLTAMVTLQEANAVAILNIATATFTAINPLGLKNFSPHLVDFSDRDGTGNTWSLKPLPGLPVYGMFMPDVIASYQSGGQAYYITANEGDDRNDFLAPPETTAVAATTSVTVAGVTTVTQNYDLDNTLFPTETILKGNAVLGRLTVSNLPGLRGDLDNDGDIDRILSYGGRSFSILDASGKRIFDSGDLVDRILFTYYPALYDDSRSDNKSAEPEGVAITVIDGKTYAFIGLERAHSVLVFDVTNPAAVTFTTLATRAGDLNPEGMLNISAADSPTGKPLLLVANEVSYTLTTYEVATAQPAFQVQLLHYYGESGLLGLQTAPIMGAMIDKFDDQYANTLVIAEGDSFIPGPWLIGGADPTLNRVLHTGTFTSAADTTATPLAQADIAIMNAFNTTVSALGNHEFDLGSPVLAAAIFPANSGAVGNWAGARFPIITSNLDFSTDSSLRGFADTTLGGTTSTTTSGNYRGAETTTINARFAPYAVKTIGGEKVGFVGATTWELLTKSSPNGTRPKDDANSATSDLQEVAAFIQSTIDALKATGVNKIIMVDQLDDLQRNKDLAPLLTGVDVMVAGGGHERMGDATDIAVAFNGHDADFIADVFPIVTAGADGKPTLLVTTDTEYSYLGRLVVNFDTNGELVPGSLDPAINGAYASAPAILEAVYNNGQTAAQIVAASPMASRVKAITDAINTVIQTKDGTLFGYTKVYMEGDRVFGRTQEVNLGDVTADANASKAKAALGLPSTAAVCSLKNGGGLRASLGSVAGNGAKIPPLANPLTGKPAGAISRLDVENALRFDNKLVVFDTTPAGLLNILNFAAGLSSGPTNQNGGYPQVGNIRFSYEASRPAGQKVRSVVLVDDDGKIVSKIVENGLVLPGAQADIPVVALNFTANGGDGYPIKYLDPVATVPNQIVNPETSNFRFVLNNATLSPSIARNLDFTAAANVPATAVGEQQAFSDYLTLRHNTPAKAFDVADTAVALDTRIQQIPSRTDTVLFSPVEIWRLVNFGNAAGSGPNQGVLADADSDGTLNLFEFAFGTNPSSNVTGPPELIYTGTLAGNGTLALPGQPVTKFEPSLNNVDFRAIFVRRKDFRAAGLTYTPQFSTILNTWQNSSAVPTVLADDGTWQVVSVPYTRSVAGRKATFFRIAVDLAP